jgi:hypothetical protein
MYSMNWRSMIVALLAIAACASAHAWGDQGHRITGHIASALLTDAARSQLQKLTGTNDLSQIATILDDERDKLEQRIPGSSRWHYENRQVCPRTSASKAECPNGQCITRQIERFVQTLNDAHSSRAAQTDAVRSLAHLLGDLHQPLHVSDNNDRGGNDLPVLLPGEKKSRNLHEVWDTRLVRMNLRRRNEQRYALELLANFSARQSEWSQGGFALWADETYRLSKERAYHALPQFTCGVKASAITLTDSYVTQARETVEMQLAKAGIRLASVLNAALN